MSSSALSVRPFTWDQLDALEALFVASSGNTSDPTAETLRAQLAFPGATPERDVYLAFSGPTVLGFGRLHPEPTI